MKSSVEHLSPTRVRINVEVPFEELEPDFQRAYKELAKQVRLPGFRPGKAPIRLLEARFGREAMLDQIVNDALPSRYGQALAESEIQPLGRPDIEVTRKEYGQDLAFTAEVDVRPNITLPDLGQLTVSVEPIEVSDDDVETELQSLRVRFGTLNPVERPVAVGDFVTIDLSATVDGEEVPNAAAEGLSHEVGSGRLIAGLDDAIVGLSVDESRVFTAKLAASEHAGRDAEVTVTVRSVKERELPDPTTSSPSWPASSTPSRSCGPTCVSRCCRQSEPSRRSRSATPPSTPCSSRSTCRCRSLMSRRSTTASSTAR
ncbi:trigger factor [Mycobacterium kansasii]|uniref:peptidylprolyl isomerase n=1 Tax=Mycobacterium kansasii TaxID=1768 RepID=A0A1V3XL19_MYCKA|nr:trigger factor [Mycobacterium kansasii]